MAEKGRLLLIKRGDGGGPEAFTTVAGLRESSFTLNGETVDVTNKDSAGWRTLLAGAGTTSMSVSGSGVFEDNDTTYISLETAAAAKTLDNYEIVFESGDKWAGAFQVGSVGRAGSHNGEVSYDLTLESSGAITFTAA